MIKDFINLADFGADQLRRLIGRTIEEKRRFREGRLEPTLVNKTLAMVFEKPSLRTRVSFEAAMTHLGGHAVYLAQADIGLGKREPVQDVARVLARVCDGIVARTFSHDGVVQFARHADVPVVNALSDYSHPCQAMADLVTAAERLGELAGRKLAFIGDGNNVARSLAVACSKLQMPFTLASPAGYDLEAGFLDGLAGCKATRSAAEAVADADIVYTDTWVSMGQEAERQKRLRDFEGFQVNAELLAEAPSWALVMHCLPAYRGCEISEEAFEAHAGTIFEEAENRLHFQRTLLNVLLGEGGIA
jgi:ornithine carbamoyltransferase